MSDELAMIFDMDGVLIDTYHAHFQSWQEMSRAAGLEFTEAQFAATFGRTSREVIRSLWGDRGWSDQQIAAMDAAKELAFRQIIQRDFPAMPGVHALLQALHGAGFRLAVGSSAPPENVDFILDRLDARELFEAVVTGRDVTRGKPDPQVFLLAAERLRISPACCAVLEDAPVGIAAARAAGMTVVGLVSTGRTREALSQADLVIDRLGVLSADVLRTLMRSHFKTLGNPTKTDTVGPV